MASTGEVHGLFWDSDGGDRKYNSGSFERWLKKFFTVGVFNGDLQVQANSGMTIAVGTGYANVDGKVRFWDDATEITLDAANSTYPRIDTIVITRDNVNRDIFLEKVTGAYSGDSPQPTAPIRNSEEYQLVLAQIYVGAGTTSVTQSNITDTRSNVDLCGYITGTVTEMDYSQFAAQFAAYYTEFVNGHEADFDAWETAQQTNYSEWFAEVVAQMQSDHADFEDWFENLQDQLDTDQVTHLQNQIDDIYTMLPAGSHITVTTEETTLYSMDVTITDGTNEVTSQFDNEGVAIFKTLPYIGNFRISSTDGMDTAKTTVSIPYYGRYAYEISFWNAYVNISGGTELAGAVVTVTNSEEAVVGTVTLNASGEGQFNAKEPDLYTFTTTYGSDTVTAEVDVIEQDIYSVSLIVGWARWVTLGGLDPSNYSSLEDVFDDEPAVRRLMTVHASCDYLISQIAADISYLDNFTANDTAMKWIGLRDYVCDGLTNIAGVEAEFLDSDYWERYLKDHVPEMTSDTAPYGQVSASSVYTPTVENYKGYKAFDGNYNTGWAGNSVVTSGNVATGYIQYGFSKPTCVKRLKFTGGNFTTQAILKASNDGGSSWSNLATYTDLPYDTAEDLVLEVDNYNYYRTYRLELTQRNAAAQSAALPSVRLLNFLGRTLNVSAPIMTSNTAPYGEASASQEATYDSSHSQGSAWMAFDGSTSDGWGTVNTLAGSWLKYDFGKPVKIQMAEVSTQASVAVKYRIEGSNDGSEWLPLTSEITGRVNNNAFIMSKFTQNVDDYRYYRFYCTGGGNQWLGRINMQYYGVDYTEREFATGSTMKYLYDHGLEFETATAYTSSASCSAVKNEDNLEFSVNAAQNNMAGFTFPQINLDSYSLLRAKVGDSLTVWESVGARSSVLDNSQTSNVSVLGMEPSNGNLPDAYGLNISSLDSSYYIACFCANTSSQSVRKGTLKELWLE